MFEKLGYNSNCFTFRFADSSLDGEAQIGLPTQMLTFPSGSPSAHLGSRRWLLAT